MAELPAQLRRKRDRASAQAQNPIATVETWAGDARARVPEPAAEGEMQELQQLTGGCVERRRFAGEEPAGDGAIGVGVLVAARAVEARAVAMRGLDRVGDELAGGVVAVVGREGGGAAGEEGGGAW